MQGYFVVNVRKMQEQADCFREEERISKRLYSRVRAAQNLAQPEKENSYRAVLNEINQLSSFYQKMGSALDETANMISVSMTKSNMQLEETLIQNTKKFNLNG